MTDEVKPPEGDKKPKATPKVETRGRKKHVDVKVLFGSLYSRGRYYEMGQIMSCKEEDVGLLVEQGLAARV